jgi:reverse transcriptase-like protein
MNVEQSMCAASGPEAQWVQIDWTQCELKVRRLQECIVKATQEGRHGKVKALQWLLTHSFHGRALAVKRVTHNQGKNTPEWTERSGALRRPDTRPLTNCDGAATRPARGVAQDAPFFIAARLERRAGALTETGGKLCMCVFWELVVLLKPAIYEPGHTSKITMLPMI